MRRNWLRDQRYQLDIDFEKGTFYLVLQEEIEIGEDVIALPNAVFHVDRVGNQKNNPPNELGVLLVGCFEVDCNKDQEHHSNSISYKIWKLFNTVYVV